MLGRRIGYSWETQRERSNTKKHDMETVCLYGQQKKGLPRGSGLRDEPKSQRTDYPQTFSSRSEVGIVSQFILYHADTAELQILHLIAGREIVLSIVGRPGDRAIGC